MARKVSRRHALRHSPLILASFVELPSDDYHLTPQDNIHICTYVLALCLSPLPTVTSLDNVISLDVQRVLRNRL